VEAAVSSVSTTDQPEEAELQPASAGWVWPDDYVPLDADRLRVRPDFVPVFHARGWTSAVAVLSDPRIKCWRRLPDRDNCVVELPRSTDERLVRAHCKRHRTRRSWLSRLLAIPSPGIAEANVVGRCQRLGIPTISIIAAGEVADSQNGPMRSFLMTQELQGAVPADDYWRSALGPPGASDPAARRRLLTAMARIASRLHRAGLFHRDFYWCHFLVHRDTAGRFRVHLIDLQRVAKRRILRWRWLLKDLAQFVFSMPEANLSEAEKRFWFCSYLGVERLSWAQWMAYRVILWRAELYRWKEGPR
jgi:hypothetical protein